VNEVSDHIRRITQHFHDIPVRWDEHLPYGPVTLPWRWGLDLDSESARLLELVRRSVLRTGADAGERHRALCQDDQLLDLRQDESIERNSCDLVARPDVVRSSSGWRFIEYNVSCAVGGMTYVDLFNSFWKAEGHEHLRLDSPLATRSRLLSQRFASCEERAEVAIVGSSADMKLRHPRYYRLELESLRRHGIAAHFYEVEEFASLLSRGVAPHPLVVMRVDHRDWLSAPDRREMLRRIYGSSATVLAPQTATQMADKSIFARLSCLPAWLSEEDRDLVERCVPWTRQLASSSGGAQAFEVSVEEVMSRDRESLVLKPTGGSRSRQVHVGRCRSADEWAAAVTRASSSGRWVVQEAVSSVPIPVRVVDRAGATVRTVQAPCLFGPLRIGGAMGGCMVRFDAAGLPGDALMSADSSTVKFTSAGW
jgi:hypothetical protein